MKKKIVRALGAFLAVMMLTGCTAGNKPVPSGLQNEPMQREPGTMDRNYAMMGTALEVPEMEITTGMTGALSHATVNLLNETVKSEGENKNILISPLSIQMALGMTANGAEGDSKKEMEEFVAGGLTTEELNYILLKTMERYMTDTDVMWNVANGIWLKDDGMAEFKQEFLNQVRTYYNAELYMSEFDESTLNNINHWVDHNTNYTIHKIIEEIPENARTILVNAIAFEGEWKNKYEEDDILENRTFTNADGSESKVTMLYSKENKYFTLGKGEGFIKPYEGGNYAFVGILPEEGMTPEEYIASLERVNEEFSMAVTNPEYVDVDVTMPEFTCEYDTSLVNIYKNMGMELPFDENAGLGNMLQTPSGDPYSTFIGQIVHKTHIEVDRKGTKAAAATAVITYDNAVAFDETKSIVLDRPFVYAVVDTETGLPLFMGIQNMME